MSRLPDTVKADDIPRDLNEIRRTVRGLLVHRDFAAAYGVAADDIRLDEQNLRSVHDVLVRALELCDDPLPVARPPTRRVQGICRHFALLQVAFLRAHGIPARMRCGFANYFDTSKWSDHWITERWNGERWVRDDPQVDKGQRAFFNIDFDVNDQPPGKFLSANEAWVKARSGEIDAALFGIADMWGLGYIAGNVISDFACLNRMEMLPWDAWSPLSAGPPDSVSQENAAAFDELCALMASGDVDAMRARYESDDRLRVPT